MTKELLAAFHKHEEHMAETHTIELDCAPGMTRPDDLLPGVLEGTGLDLGPTIGRFFGNYTWEVPKAQEALFLQHRETIKTRIKALYDQGYIRYGSW